MINICLCIKIHVPAIQAKYRFSDVHHDHRYFNEDQMEEQVKNIYTNNLLPFFDTLRNICFRSDKKFKVGLSISGISIKLFEKYVPEALEYIAHLVKSDCVEILSEPWSHSIVAYFNMKALHKQITMHDQAVQSAFGKKPEIFIVHSPSYLKQFPQEVSSLGKKAIFTNLNLIQNNENEKMVAGKNSKSEIVPLLPINYKLSEMVQKIDFNSFLKTKETFARRIVRRFKSAGTEIPVILIYDPIAVNGVFPFSRILTWKNVILELLNNPDIAFNSPSEAVKIGKTHLNGRKLGTKIYNFSTLPDKWRKNVYQKDAFEKQLRVNTLIQEDEQNHLKEHWDLLQDMEHLFYMSYKFNNKEFVKNNFNPFSRNEDAFINYSSVLDDLLNSLEDRHYKGESEIKA